MYACEGKRAGGEGRGWQKIKAALTVRGNMLQNRESSQAGTLLYGVIWQWSCMLGTDPFSQSKFWIHILTAEAMMTVSFVAMEESGIGP